MAETGFKEWLIKDDSYFTGYVAVNCLLAENDDSALEVDLEIFDGKRAFRDVRILTCDHDAGEVIEMISHIRSALNVLEHKIHEIFPEAKVVRIDHEI